jgi:hypothetical protein
MRLLIAGLAFAIIANCFILWMAIDGQLTVLPAGNAAAIVICAGAIWLIRARMKGQL